MPIHITVDAVAKKGADWLLSEREMSEARRAQILPITKYNLLVNAFNTSTVFLVVALASAILFSFATSFVVGAVGLFVRLSTEKEISAYSIARNQEMPNHLQQLAEVAMNVIGIGRRAGAGSQILANLGAEQDREWEENEILFFDYPIWKNKVRIPPDPAHRTEPAAAAPVPRPPAPGLLAAVANAALVE